VQAVELCDSPQWSALQEGFGDAGPVDAAGQAKGCRGAAATQFWYRGALGLQPPHIGVADEPARTRTREHDGMDAGIAVDAVDQLVEFVGDVDSEEAVRSAVEACDQDGSAVLDLEVFGVVVCHGRLLPSCFVDV
jgi:hypothetical protein